MANTGTTTKLEFATLYGLRDLDSGLWGRAMDVSPELAEEWLTDREGQNRTINDHRVDEYFRMMKEDYWMINGEPILFDENGKLLNGQHRLWATMRYGKTLQYMVIQVTGDPEALMSTLDQGKPRSGGDVLVIRGYASGNNVNALGSAIYRWERGMPFSMRVTPTEMMDTLHRHPDLVKSLSIGRRLSDRFSGSALPSSALAALHYLFRKIDEAEADEFFERLIDGSNLSKGDPVLTLRETIDRNKGPKKLAPRVLYFYTIKAWNAERRREQLRVLKFLSTEAVPEIHGLPSPKIAVGK